MSATMTRGLGGSDIAALVGLSPWKTPFDVYARIMMGEAKLDGVRLRLGNLAEPEILKDYCERHGIGASALQRNVELAMADKPHFRGELDALAIDKSHGVECKLVGFRQADRWGEDGSDEIPDEYLCQVAWYAMLAKVGLMRIAAWFDGGGDYREFEYTRNPEFEAALIEAANKFWTDHILKEVPPSPFGASADSIRTVFPSGNGKLREATFDEIMLVGEFEVKRDAAKQAEKELDEVKSKLQAAIAHEDGLTCALGKVTWKQVQVKPKTDWEEVAKRLNPPADLINEHTKTNAGYRRFLFTPKKG